MSVKFLKIPEHCYSRSKGQGIVNDVEFFYQLKLINIQGFFERGTVSTLNLPYSKPSIWRKIKRLVDLNLIRHNSNGYQLVSYDTLFQHLGYDLSRNGIRNGSFKIHRIPYTQCSNIKDLLAFIDIRDNLNKQTHQAYLNFNRTNQYAGQKLYCSDIRDKRHTLSNLARKNTVQMINSNDNNVMLHQMGIESTHCNPDITLSLKGLCNLLGLSNTSSANAIVDRLVAQKRLNVRTRQLFLETTTLTYTEFKSEYDGRHIYKEGAIFRTLPNLITCIN